MSNLPIKVAIIGLSSNAATGWASSAHLPYLLAFPDKYKIVALLNSSVEAAKEAVKSYKLPESTKTYGDPQDLANDKEVQLVVCAVRVDKHLPTTLPSIKAGKDVFVEWPLASNLTDAKEMLESSQISGSKTMVGLQGRFEPSVVKIRELIREGRIGSIRSVDVESPQGRWSQLPESLDYFSDRKVGGNHLTIAFAHAIDSILSAVGDLEPGFFSKLYKRIPEVKITKDGKEIRVVEKDTFDHFILHGTLQKSGAPFTFLMRNGRVIEGNPFLTWRIHGEKGDIQITTPGPFINVGYGNGTKIKVVEDEKPQEEEVIDVGKFSQLPQMGQNIGRLYESFAEGRRDYPTFSEAVKLHEKIDQMYNKNI